MSETNWTDPASGRSAVYPLELFHEIDFDVNEGYRRIPHGGIEVGGLLFGRVDGNLTRIEARRAIECEHAFGPSFKLSSKDLEGIKEQLRTYRTDSEIAPLEPVGWFLAHTRSDLVLTDAEASHFQEFFPHTGHLTVLVKPEKFKPTRFALLIRAASGAVERDGNAQAFILPLPGRAGSRREPAAPVAVKPLEPQAPAQLIPPEPPPSTPTKLPEPPRETLPATPLPKPLSDVAPEEPSTRPISLPPSPPSIPAPTVEPVFEAPLSPSPVQLPSSSLERAPAAMSRKDEIADDDETLSLRPRRRRPAEARREPPTSARVLRHEEPRSKSLLIAVFAAVVLGCALGYWLYLQMPPEVLSVKLDPKNGRYVISWPPDQTRGADSVLMRINDGEPVPIPLEDRLTGQTQIPSTDTRGVKIEIIAKHKLRDSRGIVRYVK